LSSTSVAYNGSDNSNIFARLGQANIGNLLVTGDIGADGSIVAGADVIASGDVIATGDMDCEDLTVTKTINCRDMNVNETSPSFLSGITFKVGGTNAGRVNSDGTNMIFQGLTGTNCDIQLKCGTIIASDIQKDGSNNITFTVGGPGAPETRLRKETTAGVVEYVPSLMKSTSAISTGSTVSFTNTAEVLTNSAVTAPYTGYYQFMAQFTSTSIGSFDAGTDVMTFYADISGGALTPLVGSIKDITNVTATTFETTFSGYAFATAGDIIRLIHIDTGTFTISGGALFVLWQYMGAGAGLA
jgi:hypothetical protein